jgi:hypothetical protein
MDLLFKRYASPFLLLDGYIQTSRLCEFIDSLCKRKVEDDRWEYFLHKVWDKSYPEFIEAIETSQELHNMSEKDVEKTVQKSMNILQNFSPQGEEGEK